MVSECESDRLSVILYRVWKNIESLLSVRSETLVHTFKFVILRLFMSIVSLCGAFLNIREPPLKS